MTNWKQQLRDSPLALDLPTYYPCSPNQTRTWATHSFMLSAQEISGKIEYNTDMVPEGRPTVVYLEDLQFLDRYAGDNLPISITPRNLAYVIYTSGSTGLPRGAMIEHRGMLNHIYAKINGFQLMAADNVAQTASQCFDISVWQLLAVFVLLVGGHVHIFPDMVAHIPAVLLERPEDAALVNNPQESSIEAKVRSSRCKKGLFERVVGVMQRQASRVSRSRFVSESNILSDDRDKHA